MYAARRLLLALAAASMTWVGAYAQDITGFRTARFGMGEAEVRQAMVRDFQARPGAIVALDNANEGTRVLSMVVPALEPGPGPATVSYILGASTKRLMHVNVAWFAGASQAERDRLAAAGLLLARHFQERDWAPGRVGAGVREAPLTLLLFAGVDKRGSAVELRLSGVPVAEPGGATDLVPSDGPSELRLAYSANAARPDITRMRAAKP